MSLISQLESLLFVSPKPLSLKDLASILKAKPADLQAALKELGDTYEQNDRGFCLVDSSGTYQLTTAVANAELIRDFLKDETAGELSQPSLEALTIIAYRGPISKLQLDKIRGVNCSLIVRNLLLRGLIEEKFDKDKNENYYTVTVDFVRFLGLRHTSDLPDYERLNQEESLSAALERGSEEI